MVGYLAFPPFLPNHDSYDSAKERACNLEDDRDRKGDRAEERQHEDDERERVYEKQQRVLLEARRLRLEKEREITENSEMEWVRSGGILRDAYGRRDKVRTERVRQELRLQVEEKRRIDRWEGYEGRWSVLLSSEGPLTFMDIPWPLQTPPSTRDIKLLCPKSISEFLFESLSVRSNITTRRERIRSSLLRWHPDKTSSLVKRVVQEDVDIVRDGINAVFHCLKGLQDAERTGQSTEQQNYMQR
ncbi:hypothetical protein BV22DRAFT_474890 [Leucogyrophana mollusca]|uniref:Uncharacterized protein n=1 Tax=Leucogyrophana mollusca TaxID=85980 RepID=A0ACB8BHF2_9AGAM|nr:hypothetical protein BV22DRAFT_474890 [Leucogyrophana mollusca]